MNDERITPKTQYGEHIELTCKNHPTLSGSTKNIGCENDGTVYFARHIYFEAGTECNCPASMLIIHPELKEKPDVPT